MLYIAVLLFLLIFLTNWWLGLWSNLLSLVNFLLAAFVASSMYESVAAKLSSISPEVASYDYLLDFVSIWLIFFLCFGLLRATTEFLSPKKLSFDPLTDKIGAGILSLWLAAAFLQFMFFTFHFAPLAPSDFASNPREKVLNVGPDRMWASLIQSRSRGALSTGKDASLFGLLGEYNLPTHPDDAKLDARVFDPQGEFVFRQSQRRKNLAGYPTLRKGK